MGIFPGTGPWSTQWLLRRSFRNWSVKIAYLLCTESYTYCVGTVSKKIYLNLLGFATTCFFKLFLKKFTTFEVLNYGKPPEIQPNF